MLWCYMPHITVEGETIHLAKARLFVSICFTTIRCWDISQTKCLNETVS